MQSADLIQVIREAIRRKGTNPSRLAKDHGLSVNAVRYILEGRAPTSRRLAQVCDALGLEFYVGPPRHPAGTHLDQQHLADELERLAGEARRLAQEQPPLVGTIEQSTAFVLAPRYEVLAAAGSGAQPDAEEVRGHLGFSRRWLKDQGLAASRLAVIEVVGDSMEPTLHGGDVVLLDMREPRLRDGAIYTVRRDQDLLVKRLRKQGSDDWQIVSDNLDYPVEPLTPEIEIVGRVVWLGRTFAEL